MAKIEKTNNTKQIQGGTKGGLQLYVGHSLFLHYYLLIIVLFSIRTTVNLHFLHPLYSLQHRISTPRYIRKACTRAPKPDRECIIYDSNGIKLKKTGHVNLCC